MPPLPPTSHVTAHRFRPFGDGPSLHFPRAHPLSPSRYSIAQEHLDARLTDLGKQQCAKLKATKHDMEKEAELVVVSPLTRAIQTAMLTIDKVREKRVARSHSTSVGLWLDYPVADRGPISDFLSSQVVIRLPWCCPVMRPRICFSAF